MKINKRKLRKLGEEVSKEGASQYDHLLFSLASNVLYHSDSATALAVALLKEEGIIVDEKTA